jgi:hypothetical protein
MQCLEALCVRLDFPDLGSSDQARLHSIRHRATVQLRKRCAFGIGPGDHEDAPLAHGDASFSAKGTEAPTSFDTQSCLLRSRLQIVAGMDNAAVAQALMQSGFRFFLDDEYPVTHSSEVGGCTGADRSGADDDDIAGRD